MNRDEEDFDDIFDSSVDKNPRRSSDCGSSPIISSGVSSTISKAPSQPSPAVVKATDSLPAPKQKFNCTWEKCTKSYVNETRFKNHVFIHKMGAVNQHKPTKENIFPHITNFVVDILNEMSREPNIVEDKYHLLEEIINCKGSEHWNILVESLSDLICSSLAKRTKLLPSNQYEEFQCYILTALNDSDTFSSLKLELMNLLSLQKFSAYVGNVVYRLVVRLGENVQSYLISKMKRQIVDKVPPSVVNMSEQEEKAFKLHLRHFFVNYYLRAVSLKNEVWEARSLCLRNRFVINVEGEPVGRLDIQNNSMWEDGELDISDNALHFFKGIEMIVRLVFQSTGKYNLEHVLEQLIDPLNSDLLGAFHALVTGYLGENDTLSFLREMVQLFYSLSIRKQQQQMLQGEGEKSALAKFSLRDGFKGRSSKSKKKAQSEQQPPHSAHSQGELQSKEVGKQSSSDKSKKQQPKKVSKPVKKTTPKKVSKSVKKPTPEKVSKPTQKKTRVTKVKKVG